MHANVCCVGISGQLQFSVFVCVVVPYTVFSLQCVSKVLASPQLSTSPTLSFFELCRPPHHHSFPLLPLSIFCYDTLPHRVKLCNLLPSFFRPADPTQTAEALGGRGGRREMGEKGQKKGGMAACILCASTLCL